MTPPGLLPSDEGNGPKAVVPSGVVADAVHLACRAPSFHNSQPWRFVGEGAGVLHLFLDRDRLVETDSSGRQALISCGAVLDHLLVAMAAAGWSGNVDYYPDPDDGCHLAAVEFVPSPSVTDAQRRRADAILARRTDRLPFAAPEPGHDVASLSPRVVDQGLAHLDVLTGHMRGRLAEVSALTEALRLYDSPYHAELAWWTGPFATHDGIPHSSLVSAAESDRVDVGRTFPVTHHGQRRAEVAEDHSQVLVVSAVGDGRRDILACGEALSATLLEATMAGLSTCPLTHLTEVPATREMVGALIGRSSPQVLIRVGVVPALDDVPPPTPRRPLTDVLSWQPSVSELTG